MTDVVDVVADFTAPAAPGIQLRLVVPGTITDSEDARWRQWQQQGRDDAAQFRRRVKTVIVDVAAVVAFASALWLSFRN